MLVLVPVLHISVLLIINAVVVATKIPKSIKEHSLLRVAKTASLVSTAWLITQQASRVVAEESPVLGVKEGLLRSCGESYLIGGCVASQDDRPLYFQPPWQLEGDWQTTKLRLLTLATALSPQRIVDEDRYVRLEFFDTGTGRIDDVEFYFTVGDSTLQFRSARRGSGLSDFGVNRERLEKLRIRLGLENVIVLRNRRRVLEFVESPLDIFGPSTNAFERQQDMLRYNGVCSSDSLWETRQY